MEAPRDTARNGRLDSRQEVEDLWAVSAAVTVAVAERAAADGLARVGVIAVQQVQGAMWRPEYRAVRAS